MKSKKIMAVALTAAMVAGNSATVFAEDPAGANSATGTGTSFEHVNKEITSVTLPTTAEVANVFDYYVDPERLINDAGTLADGTTEVEGNAAGVYFKNSGTSEGTPAVDASVASYLITNSGSQVSTGLTVTVPTTLTDTTLTYLQSAVDSVAADGWYNNNDDTGTLVSGVTVTDDNNSDAAVTPSSGDTITVTPYQAAVSGGATTSYSNASDAVRFEGKNSVDVDVSVTAAITASTGGKDIAFVADEDALSAAKTPALLMTLKVGENEKAITSSGATASAKVAGVPDNFAVTTENNKYVYKVRTNTDEEELDDWGATTVQLIGKTNTADVPEGANALTAPQIALTWTVAKSTTPAEPEVTTTPASAVIGSGTADVLIRLVSGTNADVSKITSVKVNDTDVASANIAVSGSGNVWLKGVASESGTYEILITYDGTTYSATYTK